MVWIKRLQSFAQSSFQFKTADGWNLPAQLAVVEQRQRVDRQSPFAGVINPVTRQYIPEASTAAEHPLPYGLVLPLVDPPTKLGHVAGGVLVQ